MLANILSRYWWTTLLRGVIAILFGVMLLARPGISLAALLLVFGVFALVDGLVGVVAALGGRREHESWWVLLLASLAGIGIGLLTFYNPGATALAILFYIAIWAIATGVLQIAAAVRLRKEIQGEFWLALSGLASVAFGLFLAARPGEGALAVLWLIGAYAIALGVILVILSFAARGFAKRVKAAASA
jgi:uncharacterized membrane protein HdeD (DUF308 family)